MEIMSMDPQPARPEDPQIGDKIDMGAGRGVVTVINVSRDPVKNYRLAISYEGIDREGNAYRNTAIGREADLVAKIQRYGPAAVSTHRRSVAIPRNPAMGLPPWETGQLDLWLPLPLEGRV